MKTEQQSQRKSRTRQMIQLGGLLQRSGLLDAFLIAPGEDLQDYEHRHKAAKLLGFLHENFEEKVIDEDNVERWQSAGERLLKS
jgi:uncharacterized protein YjgD (DUF1641 family)